MAIVRRAALCAVRRFTGAVLVTMSLVGCGSNADDASEFEECAGGGCEIASVGCQAWRDSTCSYIERCGDQEGDCRAAYRDVLCRSEHEAELCAQETALAACGALPQRCRPSAIAETTVAVASCRAFQNEVCRSAAACGLGPTVEQCMARPILACESAVGIRGTLPQCLDELKTLSCAAWAPPSSCQGAILVTDQPEAR